MGDNQIGTRSFLKGIPKTVGGYQACLDRKKRAEAAADRGDLAAAVSLLRENLTWCQANLSLNPMHEMTLWHQESLATHLAQQGAFTEALVHIAEAYDNRQSVAPDSQDTLDTLDQYAFVLAKLGQHNLAASKYQLVWEARKKALGETNPLTLTTGFELACCWFNMGMSGNYRKWNIERARDLHQTILEARERESPPDVLAIAMTREELAQDFLELGEYEKARELACKNVGLLGPWKGRNNARFPADQVTAVVQSTQQLLSDIDNRIAIRDHRAREEQARQQADRQRRLREEQEQREREELARAQRESEWIERERLEWERLENERIAREMMEMERLRQIRLEKERLEKQRLEEERLGKERLEKERLEKERLENERLAREMMEREKAKKIKLEKERLERERIEKENLARQQEEERRERELAEQRERENKANQQNRRQASPGNAIMAVLPSAESVNMPPRADMGASKMQDEEGEKRIQQALEESIKLEKLEKEMKRKAKEEQERQVRLRREMEIKEQARLRLENQERELRLKEKKELERREKEERVRKRRELEIQEQARRKLEQTQAAESQRKQELQAEAAQRGVEQASQPVYGEGTNVAVVGSDGPAAPATHTEGGRSCAPQDMAKSEPPMEQKEGDAPNTPQMTRQVQFVENETETNELPDKLTPAIETPTIVVQESLPESTQQSNVVPTISTEYSAFVASPAQSPKLHPQPGPSLSSGKQLSRSVSTSKLARTTKASTSSGPSTSNDKLERRSSDPSLNDERLGGPKLPAPKRTDSLSESPFDAMEERFNDKSVDRWFRDVRAINEVILDPFRRTAGKRVRIAVLDTGVDMNHNVFKNKEVRRRIKKCEDFVDREGDATDVCGHGTHCVTVLNRVAPWADIYVARVAVGFEKGPDPDVVAKAIRRALGPKGEGGVSENWDVDILSLSLGFKGYNRAVKAALDDTMGRGSGKLVVAAASNPGTLGNMAFPASAMGIIAMNSATGNGIPSSFNPRSTKDEKRLTVLGEAVTSAWTTWTAAEDGGDSSANQNATKRMKGTSVATPIAAGIMALILEAAMIDVPDEEDTQKILQEVLPWLRGYEGMMAVLMDRVVMRNGYYNIVPHRLLDPTWPEYRRINRIANKLRDILTDHFGDLREGP